VGEQSVVARVGVFKKGRGLRKGRRREKGRKTFQRKTGLRTTCKEKGGGGGDVRGLPLRTAREKKMGEKESEEEKKKRLERYKSRLLGGRKACIWGKKK